MKKGLVMSAVLMALTGTASEQLHSATYAAGNLAVRDISHCTQGDCPEIQEFIHSVDIAIAAISTETEKWRQIGQEIDFASDPMMYFDDESYDELKNTESVVRGQEEILKLQCASFLEMHGDDPLSRDVIDAIKRIRRSVAMLRSSIVSIVRTQNQLQPATKGHYQAKFDATAEKLAMLHEATQSAYLH